MRRIRQAKRDAKELFRLCCVDGFLDSKRALQVVERIGASKNRNRLNVLMHFRRLVKLDFMRRLAVVESAAPVPPEMRATLLSRLERQYGPGLTVNFADNPALIGGMRIQVGSDVYDGSIRTRLAALESTF
jgi:F-type H+-transporting ATPase subunit delta